MNITCTQSDLNAALRTVARAVGNGKTHPILAGVCLVATDDGQLHATAYDLDIGIHTVIAAAVATPGSTVVPYRLLADICSRLSDAEALSLATEGERLTLTTAGGSYSLSTASADDFPALPAVKAAAGAPVDLSAPLAAVLPACSSDVAKQLLTGIHIAADGAAMRLEATDGHRLAMRAIPCDLGAVDAVIPARTMALVRQPASIAFDAAHAAITLADGTRIITRLLDGTYPNAKALVPTSYKATITADRDTLLHAMERVAVIADQHNGIIKLQSTGKALKISAEAETNSGTESVSVTGKLPSLAVNVHYFIDGLRAFDAGTITINANDAGSPITLTCDGEDQTYLIMPVQIRED